MEIASVATFGLYGFIGLIFLFGFLLAMLNLQKIKIIEGKKSGIKEILISIIFGLIFASSAIFGVSILLNIIFNLDTHIYSAVSFSALLIFIVIYPLIDFIQMARPTNDAVMEIQAFIEAKFFSKVKGLKAILMSLTLYAVLYIFPISIISIFLKGHLVSIIFIWFLLFPLFYLAYFGANGVVKNIIESTYSAQIPKNRAIEHFLTPMQANIRKSKGLIALLPLLLAVNSMVQPIIKATQSLEVQTSNASFLSYVSIASSLIFGIQGFFSKYWTKKSKTKMIDFFFSAYIIAGIGINLFINFLTTDSASLFPLFQIEIFGFQLLSDLEFLTHAYYLILPVLIIQSVITLFYSIIMLIQGNSESVASVKLGVLNKALKLPTEKDLMKIKKMQLIKEEDIKKILKKSYQKIDYVTILNSIVQPPVYTKFGNDLNERLRNKAVYTISILASENDERIKEIIEYLLLETIKNQNLQNSAFLNQQCFQAMAEIGQYYPDRILTSLLDLLPNADPVLKQYILEALQTIGKSEKNMKHILEKTELVEMIKGKNFQVKKSAIQAVITMGVYANDIDLVFSKITEVLKKGLEANQEGIVLTNSIQEDESILESALEMLVKIIYKDPKTLDIYALIPFINFSSQSKDKDLQTYILMYTLKILAVLALHYPERIPLEEVSKYIQDNRPYIRYTAVDLIGNICVATQNQEPMRVIKELMIYDSDPDVRDIAIDSVCEYISASSLDSSTSFKSDVINFCLAHLIGDNTEYAQNASEAIKLILPIVNFPEVIEKIKQTWQSTENDEIFCDLSDCLTKLINVKYYIPTPEDLQILKLRLKKGSPYVKARILWSIDYFARVHSGNIIQEISAYLEDPDSEVRYNCIFALGKIGKESQLNAKNVSELLVKKFENMNKDEESLELELILEALGNIGEIYPYYNLIVTVQQGLMGDINPFCKDVASKAMYKIAKGMIKNYSRYNQGSIEERLETYGYPKYETELQPGNLVLFLIEAIQQKNLPESIINIINDSLQDLLPYYLIKDDEMEEYLKSLNILQNLLIQAYYSNFSNEILETIDWIFSLKMFRLYVEETGLLKKEAKDLTLQYTTDGEQFFDMAEFFMELSFFGKRQDYALHAYELALELNENAFYAAKSHESLGKIFKFKENKEAAKYHLEKACRLYEFQDDLDNLKGCQDLLREL